MTEKRERNLYVHVCFASIASGISLMLSIMVMFRYNYRNNLEMDYLGSIVAILSFAVAVFVGVQIYQSFNLKRDIDEQNKKLIEGVKEEYKCIFSSIMKEKERLEGVSANLENNFDKLKKEIDKLKSDITFDQVFNYARSITSKISDEYVLDAYLDALNVAIKDELSQDRIDVSIDCIIGIISIYSMETSNTKIPLLEDKRHFYYEILSSIKHQNERVKSLLDAMLDTNKFQERKTEYPSGYVRIMSDYNPDLINRKQQ